MSRTTTAAQPLGGAVRASASASSDRSAGGACPEKGDPGSERQADASCGSQVATEGQDTRALEEPPQPLRTQSPMPEPMRLSGRQAAVEAASQAAKQRRTSWRDGKVMRPEDLPPEPPPIPNDKDRPRPLAAFDDGTDAKAGGVDASAPDALALVEPCCQEGVEHAPPSRAWLPDPVGVEGAAGAAALAEEAVWRKSPDEEAPPQPAGVGGDKSCLLTPSTAIEEAQLSSLEGSVCCGAEAPADVAELLRRAEAALREGSWCAADVACGEALQLDAEVVAVWAGRGRARLQQGNFESAIQDLEEALHRSPGLVGARSDLSEAKLRLFLYPLDGSSLFERGVARAREGSWDAAVVDLGLASRLGHPAAQEELNQAKAMAWQGRALPDSQLAA